MTTPEELRQEAWDDHEACRGCEWHESDPDSNYHACQLQLDPLVHCPGIMEHYIRCHCGHAVEQGDFSYGGDGYGGRCAAMADAPKAEECENCGQWWCDGDPIPTPRY